MAFWGVIVGVVCLSLGRAAEWTVDRRLEEQNSSTSLLRYGHAFCADSDKVSVYGGFGGVVDVWFDADRLLGDGRLWVGGDGWSVVDFVGSTPSRRALVGSGCFGGDLVLFGGLLLSGEEDNELVEVADAWVWRESVSGGRTWVRLASTVGPAARHSSAVGYDGSRVLVFGGATTETVPVAKVWSDAWLLSGGQWRSLEGIEGREQPVGRYLMGYVFAGWEGECNNSDGGRITGSLVVSGGVDTAAFRSFEPLGDVWALDLVEGGEYATSEGFATWRNLRQKTEYDSWGRSRHAMGVVGSNDSYRVVMVGGEEIWSENGENRYRVFNHLTSTILVADLPVPNNTLNSFNWRLAASDAAPITDTSLVYHLGSMHILGGRGPNLQSPLLFDLSVDPFDSNFPALPSSRSQSPLGVFPRPLFLLFSLIVAAAPLSCICCMCFMAAAKYREPDSSSNNTSNRISPVVGTRAGTPYIQMISLPTVVFDKVKHANATSCAICLDEFNQDEELQALPCGHHFHTPCVRRWLQNHQECPLCKQSVMAPEN